MPSNTAAYSREYYRTHSMRQPRIEGATRAEKKCRACGIVKPRSEFTVRQSGPRVGHLVSYCKPCSVAATKAAQSSDSFYRLVQWPSKIRRLYGITVADYQRMLEAQNGRCALCGTDDPSRGNRGYAKRAREVFDIDHCHVTGKVRGLLCTRCNRLVGLAGDSAETARRLVSYLAGKD
jgi:hypothetical protein